ncbi:Geranylgeranylglyceryl phosphate synthase [bioreactor metagenome]|uniref:phosphoglycerol geranylgeranyltransferase n=1 Tax=bioreactor metagenome TaxID=1076179 RepID=A0A644WSS4_9ZZZZ
MQKQNQIYDLFLKPQKRVIILIDPDKFNRVKCGKQLAGLSDYADLILVGGSLLSATRTEDVISQMRGMTSLPVVLFPGNAMQVTDKADAILFLQLISGRNPEFLISQHVHAAPLISRTDLEVIPTSYILVDGGRRTSVEYISQSMPVPADKPDIAAATALAGKYLGHKLIYLEAGSGALQAVSPAIVSEVAERTGMPVIAGGGIRDEKTAKDIVRAGANAIVIGSLFESDPEAVIRISEKIKSI